MGPAAFIIVPHSREDLEKFAEFIYDTATVAGVTAAAGSAINNLLSALVEPEVAAATAENANECASGESKCGYFVLSLEPVACMHDYLCVKADIGGAHVGAATGDQAVEGLVIDPASGQRITLTDAFTGSKLKELRKRIRQAAANFQNEHGYSPADFPVDFSAISAWMPQPDGVHVWFEKYAIASGADGVVELIVAYPGTGAADEPTTLAASWDEAYKYICDVSVDSLPKLREGDAEPYATSIIQLLLSGQLITAGPIDGAFGPTTAKGVRALQSDYGLVVDGYVGPQTWSALQTWCEYEQAAPDQGTSDQAPAPDTNGGTSNVQLVVVPNVLGRGNQTAQRTLQAAGLNWSLRYTNGDPSIAAQAQDLCPITSQNPGPNTTVERGTIVTIQANCPQTGQSGNVGGYTGPAPPDPYSGADSGTYTGPAPPEPWTG